MGLGVGLVCFIMGGTLQGISTQSVGVPLLVLGWVRGSPLLIGWQWGAKVVPERVIATAGSNWLPGRQWSRPRPWIRPETDGTGYSPSRSLPLLTRKYCLVPSRAISLIVPLPSNIVLPCIHCCLLLLEVLRILPCQTRVPSECRLECCSSITPLTLPADPVRP